MTTFTLITGIVFVLGVALLSCGVVLGLLLLWTARRMGDFSTIRADLSTLSAQHRNLDEIFESYRKRDAQRVSTIVQRAKKQQEETEDRPTTPTIQTREDIVNLFEHRRRNGDVS